MHHLDTLKVHQAEFPEIEGLVVTAVHIFEHTVLLENSAN